MWSEDIQDLLVLLKLIRPKSNGRNDLPIESFNRAVNKLFVFRKNGTPIESLVDRKNNFPYIIACGTAENQITHYYIELEKEILNVSDSFAVQFVCSK